HEAPLLPPAPPALAFEGGDGLLGRVVPFGCSGGVSSLHAAFSRFVRNAPEKMLPPLRVTTLTTPPPKRPYSALMPDVRICASWTPSSMKRPFGWPKTLSFTSTPSTRKTFSYAMPPPIVTWFWFGPL